MLNVNRYSILGILVKTFKLSNKIFEQGKILLCYAALLSMWTLLFGFWIYTCKTGGGAFCFISAGAPQAVIGMLIWFVPLLFIYFAFSIDFYDASFNNSPFKLSTLVKIGKQKAKSLLMLYGYALGFVIPVAVGGKFLMQDANPDWRVEMGHFVIIFSLFMVMLFLIRTAAAISIYLQKHQYPNLWQLFEKTAGLGYVSIILFLLLLALSLLVYMFLVENLRLIPERQTNFMVMIAAMYADNFLKLAIVALMLLFCRAQHELLLPEDFTTVDAEGEVTEPHETPAIAEKPAKKAPRKPRQTTAETTKKTATGKPRKTAAKSTKENGKRGRTMKK